MQVGSSNSGISNVALYNWGNNTYMHLYCSAITIEDRIWRNRSRFRQLLVKFRVTVVVIDDANLVI